MPKLMNSEVRLAAEKARLAEEAHGHHRLARAQLPARRRPRPAAAPAIIGPATPSARPAVGVAAHQAPDDAEQAGADQGQAGQVERAVRVRASRSGGSRRSAAARGRSARSPRRSTARRSRRRSAPPMTGPSATARPAVPLQMPRASPRRAGGTAADRIVSVSGVTIAPPTPCRARAAIRAPMLGATAAKAEPSGEDGEADDEHALAAEAVAERGAGQQQHGEGQRVGVDGPLETRRATPPGRA